MPERTLHIEGIGAVRLVRSKRARYVNITLKPFGGIRVAVPQGVSYQQAEAVVHQRLGWIKRHRRRMKQAEEAFTLFDEDTDFSTRKHRLVLERHTGGAIRVRVGHGRIAVKVPAAQAITEGVVQQAIRRGLERAWRKEAKAYLPGRVEALARRHGLTYKAVAIKNNKTRWGSCSADNNINLNLHLMRLPDHLIDYVILHELAHTRIKNHSNAFWTFLDRLAGPAKKLDAELKQHRIQIY